jgi:hypothetical protein
MTAQSALSSAFMVKNVSNITRIAAGLSFHRYRSLKLKYDVEDIASENKKAAARSAGFEFFWSASACRALFAWRLEVA